MPTTYPAAESLVHKLQELHSTLPKPEQEALESILQVAGESLAAHSKHPFVGEPTAEIQRLNELLTEARGKIAYGSPDPQIAATITTVTITTTVASHPIITCNPK